MSLASLQNRRSHLMPPIDGRIDERNNPSDFMERAAQNRPVQANADGLLARSAQRDWDTYKQFYSGTIENLLGQLDSRDIVDSTQKRVDGMGERAQGMTRRDLSRSLAGLTPAQQKALERREGIMGATDATGQMNNARLQQRDVNQQRRSDLVSIATGASQMGSQGLGQAAGMQANRQMANANASAQNKAQLWQLGGSAALLMMGI